MIPSLSFLYLTNVLLATVLDNDCLLLVLSCISRRTMCIFTLL